MSLVTVAAIQTPLCPERDTNIHTIAHYVERAAAQGAQIILPPELFQGPYFCQQEQEEFFSYARSVEEDPAIAYLQPLARHLGVVIPVSFFEKAGPCYYNSVAVLDADGSLLGVYRKSHIPDGPGYEEKFYFRPGNSGFRVWPTRYGTIGVGVCWDQWFPEAARIMTLMGAQLLLYPTAIGSEPQDAQLNTKDPWQRAMIGHAVCNAIPVVAANRIGQEQQLTFYGHSFIANHQGETLAELDHQSAGVIQSQIDLKLVDQYRAGFGFFRDRRPDLYERIIQP
ncbi:N-carbamoylputrescine amidase [Lyngbya confervoides]|uniref:N-carbamoylputrescine amidase n=1 Tax=Lyngbya confervoides BDU141951 TaxID=1574623 RepID=A0ABD4SYV8_9CYAN|nr:N-carbamoylputrescine amidase [Lyngbya confervoides]MCM1981530.1 N-carbamoylputrescine amidase [Lyngbya confervoides BDU141951]